MKSLFPKDHLRRSAAADTLVCRRDMSKKLVSRAGKDLLVNTIRSVDHQNRVLEEKECWKSLKPSTRRSVFKNDFSGRRRSRSRSPRGRDELLEERNKNLRRKEKLKMEKDDVWGHDGFQELYPQQESRSNRCQQHKASPASSSSSEDEYASTSSSSQSTDSTSSSSSSGHEKRRKRKKTKHRKHKHSSSRDKHKSKSKDRKKKRKSSKKKSKKRLK